MASTANYANLKHDKTTPWVSPIIPPFSGYSQDELQMSCGAIGRLDQDLLRFWWSCSCWNESGMVPFLLCQIANAHISVNIQDKVAKPILFWKLRPCYKWWYHYLGHIGDWGEFDFLWLDVRRPQCWPCLLIWGQPGVLTEKPPENKTRSYATVPIPAFNGSQVLCYQICIAWSLECTHSNHEEARCCGRSPGDKH